MDKIFIDGIDSCLFMKQWGDGSYKYSFQEPSHGLKSSHKLYIPYLTPNAIWKAKVLIKFIEHQLSHSVYVIKIGYSQYSRQERMTATEPSLFDDFFKMLYRDFQGRIEFMDLHNPRVLDFYDLVENIEHYDIFNKYLLDNYKDFNAVSPDSGAYYRANKYPRTVEFEKIRDSNGVSSKIKQDKNVDITKPFIIMDDILDGGRTFIEASKHLKDKYGDNIEVMLCITHCLVPFGVEHIKPHISKIITTDTCKKKSSEDGFIQVI